MSRPSRRPSAPDRLAAPLVAVALAATLLVLQACSAQTPAATPLYSLAIDPSPPPLVIDSTPTPLPPGEGARQAFVKSVLLGDLTYHADFDGHIAGSKTLLSADGALDVAGLDYQLAITYRWPGSGTSRYVIRYVGGTAWVRIDSGLWEKEPRFQPGDTNSPFAFITSTGDVKLAKTETVAGQRLHRLTFRTGQLIAMHQILAANLTEEKYTRTRSEVVVGDDGVPVSGTTTIEGVGRISGYQLQEIVIDLDVTFSKVGADLVINAP